MRSIRAGSTIEQSGLFSRAFLILLDTDSQLPMMNHWQEHGQQLKTPRKALGCWVIGGTQSFESCLETLDTCGFLLFMHS